MLSDKKPTIEKYLDPFVKNFESVNPNILTLLGSIPPLLFFVFVINHFYILALCALLGNAFDLIDGMVARKYNKVSKFGGLLDSTVDRVSDFLTITALSFGGIVRWELGISLLFFSFLTSYIRAQGGMRDGGNANFANGVGIMERSERIFFIFVALITLIILPSQTALGLKLTEFVILAATCLSAITVLQRIIYAYKKL